MFRKFGFLKDLQFAASPEFQFLAHIYKDIYQKALCKN